MPSLYKCVVGVARFYAVLLLGGALNRRIDAGRLMAQLASAFSYRCMPQLRLSRIYHRERGVRGVSSVVCYAVL